MNWIDILKDFACIFVVIVHWIVYFLRSWVKVTVSEKVRTLFIYKFLIYDHILHS